MAYLDNVRTFIRAYELGNMSAAARDLRISAAVASARIAQLESHLNVRLFHRTTRILTPTEQGQLFYDGARRIVEAVEDAEAEVNDVTQEPRGTLFVAAPLNVGRRFIAPGMAHFRAAYPQIKFRLRLSDRRVDIAADGLDMAFFLGIPDDSNLRMRKIADCPRVLCAAPAYLDRRGMPKDSASLVEDGHDCLNLRFPGAPEFQWPLQTPEGVQRIGVTGPLEADYGDVLTEWALDGLGIVLKPRFEVEDHLRSGRLVTVLPDEPPVPVQLVCLYMHRRKQDPKARLFMDHMADTIQKALPAEDQDPR